MLKGKLRMSMEQANLGQTGDTQTYSRLMTNTFRAA